MRRLGVSLVLVLVFTILMCRCSVTAQEEPEKKIPERVVFFSTEEDFVTQGTEPSDGNPIISDGDLLTSAGQVYMRNSELLSAFNVRFDLGLDAVDVIDVEKRLVIFSTELDHPQGMFTAGDLLVTNGLIVPNAALLAAFDIPRGLDLGLDAVHLKLKGKPDDVIKFFDSVKKEGREFLMENPKALMERLQGLPFDIWFSTEGTAPLPNAPGFLDGDLLSAATGTIVLRNADALPLAVPAGIPDRGVDFGMDAVSVLSVPIKEETEVLLFSTEINGLLPTFTDGDVLRKGDGVIFPNISLISAFQPKVKDLGLDALSVGPWWITQCKFTSVGGVEINLNTWDFATGYVDPPGRPDPAPPGTFDHTFARWVSIRGIISDDAVEHRVLFRPDGGADSPIHMPLALGWEVFGFSLSTGAGGWMDTSWWKFLRDNFSPDLVLVAWDTSAIAYGKYFLTLECKDANGNIKICDELPVQIDNVAPGVLLCEDLECKILEKPQAMPVKIKGAIKDVNSHFYAYNLTISSFCDGSAQFEPPPPASAYYYYLPAPCPLSSAGTGPPVHPICVELGTLDILSVFPGTKGCRYTVRLYAFDRSLRGEFHAPANNVSDAFQPGLFSRNWSSALTNFEFYP